MRQEDIMDEIYVQEKSTMAVNGNNSGKRQKLIVNVTCSQLLINVKHFTSTPRDYMHADT